MNEGKSCYKCNHVTLDKEACLYYYSGLSETKEHKRWAVNCEKERQSIMGCGIRGKNHTEVKNV